MTDLRTAAQAVIDEYSKHGPMMTGYDSGQVALAKLRQALADTPSVDALIAEAVAKEREACAQIGEAFDKERPQSNYGRCLAVAIRARRQE